MYLKYNVLQSKPLSFTKKTDNVNTTYIFFAETHISDQWKLIHYVIMYFVLYFSTENLSYFMENKGIFVFSTEIDIY